MDYMIFQGNSGKCYYVNKEKFAGGGEGTIHEIYNSEGYVAKIFREDKRTKEREEKIRCMVKTRLSDAQLDDVTWPLDVIYDTNGFAGYIMPVLKNTSPITALYSSGSDEGFDLRYRMLAAVNLCYALKTIHSMGQVCGDLNPQNICINLDEKDKKNGFHVTLVDTDSYHFSTEDKTYRCEVGLSDYIAPELQKKMTDGNTLKTVELPTYTKETDLFALAVHIFALLMNGCHPFACAKESTGKFSSTIEQMKNTTFRDSVVAPQPIENIKDGFFPFNQSRPGLSIPIYAPQFSVLPIGIQNLFIRTFEVGYNNPSCRVSTEEWIEELSKYISADKYLKCKNEHYFFNENRVSCPFCEINENIAKLVKMPPKEEIVAGSSDTPKDKPDDSGSIFKSSSDGGKSTPEIPGGENNSKNWIKIFVLGIVILLLILFALFIKYYADNKIDEESAIQTGSSYYETEGLLSEEEIEVDTEYYISNENDYTTDDEEEISSEEKEILAWKIESSEEICDLLDIKNYKAAYEKIQAMGSEKKDILSFYYKDGQIYSDIDDGKYLYVYYDYYDSYYYIYYGYYSDGEQDGTGIELGKYDAGFYYIDGSFEDGYANGQCTLYYSNNQFANGTVYSIKISGNFTNGYEDGTMNVIYIYNDGSVDEFTRVANMGTFEVISYEDGKYIYSNNGSSIVYYEEEAGLKDHGCPNRK